jgi:phenylpropionate dioxygenase-like ring-hydroxylating dioxygenase large terminal subunit
MIPNQWYAILESNEVKRGKPIGVTRMGEKLVLWRDEQGKVVCM